MEGDVQGDDAVTVRGRVDRAGGAGKTQGASEGVVHEDKLHWYKIEGGWGSVCKILGVSVLDRELPYNNSMKDAKGTYR